MPGLGLAFVVFWAGTRLTQGASGTWNLNADGNWSNNANWTGAAYPNNAADDATFGNAITADRLLTLTENINVRTLSFNATRAYSFTGAFTLSLNLVDTTAAAFTQSGSGAVNFASGTILKLTNNSLWDGNGSGVVTVNGVVSNAKTLTKSGTFTLVLNGANTFSNGLTINSGTVEFGNDAAEGTGAMTINGGTIRAGGGARTLIENVTIGGNFTIGGSLDFTLSGTAALGTSVRTITVDNTGVSTLSGTVSGAGGGITKQGAGTLVLSGANTFTGATTVSTGVLNVRNNTGLGTTAAGTTVNSGTALQLQNNITIGTEALTLNGSGIASDGALRNISGNNTFGGAITFGSASTIASDSGLLTLSSTINNAGFAETVSGAGDVTMSAVNSGSGGLTNNSNGTLTLSGTNTFSGGVTLNSGTLALGNNAGAGTGTLTLGTATIQAATAARTLTNAMTFAGNTTFGGSLDLTLNGAGTLTGSRTFTVSNSGITTFGGAVGESGGSFSLTKAGAGTLVLSGTNTYTGGTTLNAGTLSIGSDANVGGASSGITFNGGILQITGTGLTNFGSHSVNYSTFNGGLDINNAANTFTVGSVLGGSGSLTKAGAGTLILSAANTYSGGTTISAGTLQGTTTSLQGNIVDNGTLVFDQTTNGTYSGAISGTGGVTKNNTSTVTLSGTRSYTGNTTLNGGILAVSTAAGVGGTDVFNGGALELTATFSTTRLTTLNAGGGTLTVDSGIMHTRSGVISSTGALTVNGPGTLVLSGANTFSGLLTVQNSTLSIGTINNSAANGVLGNSANAVVLGNSGTTGTLSYTGANATSTKKFTMATGGAGAFDVTSAATTLTLSGIIDGSGGLTKTGAGTLSLKGVNTYTGATTVSAGTLQLGAAGVISDASAVTVTGTLDLKTFDETIASLSGGGVIDDSGGADSTLTVGSNNTSTTFSGLISSTGGHKVLLVKVGTGTLTLSGNNTTDDAYTINAGVLRVDSAGALTAGNVKLNGGVLGLGAADFTSALGTGAGQVQFVVAGGFAAYNADRIVNLGGAGAILTWNSTANFLATGETLILGASDADRTVDFQNAIALNAAARTVQVDNGSAATDAVLSGIISGTGASGLIKTGAGTLTLSGVNTYAGGTTINGGTVAVSTATNLGAIGGGLTINAGTLEILTGFSTSRTITLGDATSTFQVDPSQTYTVTTAIGGTGSLNKTGAGTMVLGAAETYGGSTNVSAGTLQINASNRVPDASALTVSGGSFDVQTFSETVAAVTLSGGSIIGSGAGTLTGSSYNLQSGSASAILAGAGAVTKSTAGTVTLTGVNTLSGAVTISGGNLTLAGASGSALGSVSAITVNSGGTLQLGANDQVNNSATVSMAGGTIAKGNFSEGTTSSVGMGALTLTASGSHIDFGTGTVGVLSFASLNAATFTLTIDNWTGNYNTVGSGSTDRLIFDSDQSSNLGSFVFSGYGGGSAVQFNLGGGYWEVVAAVPEPSTWVGAALSLGGLAFWHLRYGRRRRPFWRGQGSHAASRSTPLKFKRSA